MSKAHTDDERRTISLVKECSAIEGGKTWLGHKLNSEAGTIDLLILKGIYTIDDMIIILQQNPTFKVKNTVQWKRRIIDHIVHLSTIEGDSRNQISGMGGHNLSMEVSDSTGIIRFNY